MMASDLLRLSDNLLVENQVQSAKKQVFSALSVLLSTSSIYRETVLNQSRDKNWLVKKMAYTQARQKAQLRLREMKNRWWNNKAAELQAAADRHDTRTFYDGLKAVYGPREAGSAPVKSLDGVTLTDRTKILERWKEHFATVLNPVSYTHLTLPTKRIV